MYVINENTLLIPEGNCHYKLHRTPVLILLRLHNYSTFTIMFHFIAVQQYYSVEIDKGLAPADIPLPLQPVSSPHISCPASSLLSSAPLSPPPQFFSSHELRPVSMKEHST